MIDFRNLEEFEETTEIELSMDEGFKEFLKEFYSQDDLKNITEEVVEDKSKTIVKQLSNKIKDTKDFIKKNPDDPFSSKVKSALRYITYAVAGAGAISIGSLMGAFAPLIIGVTAGIIAIDNKEQRRMKNDKAFFFIQDQIEWLTDKIEKTDNKQEQKNMIMLRAKYKASLLKLNPPLANPPNR